MLKALIKELLKDGETLQTILKPVIDTALRSFAPYFFLLVTLLILIVVLLALLIIQVWKGGLSPP